MWKAYWSKRLEAGQSKIVNAAMHLCKPRVSQGLQQAQEGLSFQLLTQGMRRGFDWEACMCFGMQRLTIRSVLVTRVFIVAASVRKRFMH